MKRLFYPLLFAVVLTSCSEQTDLPNGGLNERNFSKCRSVEDAIKIADKVLAADNIGSRSGAKLKGVDNAHIILGHQSRGNAADTLLYALDLEDDAGFILVAAPKGVEPIMAIIDSGSYADSESQENVAYQV